MKRLQLGVTEVPQCGIAIEHIWTGGQEEGLIGDGGWRCGLRFMAHFDSTRNNDSRRGTREQLVGWTVEVQLAEELKIEDGAVARRVQQQGGVADSVGNLGGEGLTKRAGIEWNVIANVTAAMKNGDGGLESPEQAEYRDGGQYVGRCLRRMRAGDQIDQNVEYEEYFDDGGKNRNQRMTGVEISAAGEKYRAGDHGLFVFEGQATARAGV